MQYRYLDIRRNPIKDGLLLRNKVTRHIRNFLNDLDFCEVETPLLIKSTPEGARDFVVPSRMNPGQFYALPQSPQTFKQVNTSSLGVRLAQSIETTTGRRVCRMTGQSWDYQTD